MSAPKPRIDATIGQLEDLAVRLDRRLTEQWHAERCDCTDRIDQCMNGWRKVGVWEWTVDQVLAALLDSAAVREEFGTRITWPDGKVEDRWCYRDRDDAAEQVGWFAEQIPHAVPGGSLHGATATLARRLHLTLPAETVEEQR